MSGMNRYSALPPPRPVRNGSLDDGRHGSALPTPGRASAASNRLGSVDGGIPSTTAIGNRRSMLVQPSHVKTASTSNVGRSARPQSMIGGIGGVGGRSPPRPMHKLSETVQETDTADYLGPEATPATKKSRPSLSDRTIESLSQVPPSPSPAKRRASGFYNPESPMISRPQSRAGSAMGNRPASRIGGPSGLPGRPGSPIKRPTTSGGLKQPSGLTAGRRSVSDRSGPPLPTTNGGPMGLKRRGTGLQRPGSVAGIARPAPAPAQPRSLATTSKTIGARPASMRPPAKEAFGAETPTPKPKAPMGIKSLRPPTLKPARPTSMIGGPGIRPGSRVLPKTRKPITPPPEPVEEFSPIDNDIAELESRLQSYEIPQEEDHPQEDSFSQDETLQGEEAPKEEYVAPDELAAAPELEPIPEPEPEVLTPTSRKVSHASRGLRDMIAAGRATKKVSGAFTPRGASDMDGLGISIGPDTDPNNMLDFEDNRFVNLLKKRVNAARREGKLNVSALGLTNIPAEILKMYEYDPDAKDGVAFYEMVDVTKFQAADNEIAEIPDSVFMPMPDEDATELEGQPAFSSFESIDIHGNLLTSLPPRIVTLERLTSLNLSRNKLEISVFDLISKLPMLSELRLAGNGFKGALPSSIGDLTELEVLDIHNNSITELPNELNKLSKLKRLDVHDNRLESIPFDHIFDLPLIEVLASRNRLNNALFPANVTQIPHLQTLDVSTNALFELSEVKVDLPRLQTLNIANNRVAALSDVSSWVELSSLNAEENKISAFPEGFTSLKSLKSANFSNNSLLALDDKIGDMENLTVLQIVNNPMRERRLVKLGISELKAELRARIQPPQQEQAPGSPNKDRVSLFLNGVNGQSVIGSGPAWTASAGTIEKPNSKLRDIEDAHLEPLVGQGVHTMVLHHNWLPKIPQAIGLLGASLTSLDLSNNRLNKTDPFVGVDGDALHLPNLTTLNLTSNGLTTLEPLVQGNLMAPMLATIIVPFNRIAALPAEPSLKKAFPQLTKLIAANNIITQLDVEAVRGLEVLDVSSNEIESLPPKLGALHGTLRMLMVNGNRFKVPGWGVLEKGTEEILKWCRMKIPAGEEGSMVGGED